MKLDPIPGLKDGGLLTVPGDAVEFKADGDGAGEVTAVFATMGKEDLHGDIIERGAFGEQAVLMSAYGHGSWMAGFAGSGPDLWPVGKGTIYEDGDRAMFRGQMAMDDDLVERLYNRLKFIGPQQEWSFSLHDVKAKPGKDGGPRRITGVKVHEVSPVFKGAGIRTRTTRIKENPYIDPDYRDRLEKSETERLTAELAKRDQIISDLESELSHMKALEARRLFATVSYS